MQRPAAGAVHDPARSGSISNTGGVAARNVAHQLVRSTSVALRCDKVALIVSQLCANESAPAEGTVKFRPARDASSTSGSSNRPGRLSCFGHL